MRGLLKAIQVLTIMMTLTVLMGINPVSAQAGGAADLIAAVNSLRQSQGLAPYTVSSYLMGFAQSHSDYMASLGTWTHTRADGTTAFDFGIKENVAMGTSMSVDYCVYTTWSDWTHWQTMVGYETGEVGAGVTISGDLVFYTLNVLPGNTTDNENTVIEDTRNNNTTVIQQQEETPAIEPVITSTPDKDGIIFHYVQYGESLWSIAIAYNVTIDEILKNSGLPLNTTEVFQGQRLLIQPATEPTPTQTSTPTEIPPTPTPTQPRPTMTPFPTRTPMPTYTPTLPPSLITRTLGETKYVGLGLILVSGLGLIAMIYFGFIKKN